MLMTMRLFPGHLYKTLLTFEVATLEGYVSEENNNKMNKRAEKLAQRAENTYIWGRKSEETVDRRSLEKAARWSVRRQKVDGNSENIEH